MDSYELENGYTVNVGETYIVDREDKQLGLPQGTEMTVTGFSSSPGGIHIQFECEFSEGEEPGESYNGDPVEIVAFAMKSNLDNGYMYPVTSED